MEHTRSSGRSNDGFAAVLGLAVALVVFGIYWLAARSYDAGRPDFFYLADAFLHGRLWLTHAFGPWDVVMVGARIYVPFSPFPALALVPLVAAIGPAAAVAIQPLVNAGIGGLVAVLAWLLLGRLGIGTSRRGLVDRIWLVLLLAFSTQLPWIVTRGGVWHTAQLMATALTLGALVETTGRRRPLVLGLLVGAAFLTRAPLAFAVPFFAWILIDASGSGGLPALLRVDRWPWRRLVTFASGVLPSLLFFLWYNAARFGSPLDSGYGSAALPDWLAALRAQGLFSPVHLGMNLDYLLLHLPTPIPTFPFFQPDGLGMSIVLTTPAIFLALFAPWRRSLAVALGLTTLAVLVPSLLYYGGGWLQYGFRYALDSIPFAFALCGMAVARGHLRAGWKALIVLGVLVGIAGIYWAHHL